LNDIILASQLGTDEFSHLLKGLRSGCPPHGGIALGRTIMFLILSPMTGLCTVTVLF